MKAVSAIATAKPKPKFKEPRFKAGRGGEVAVISRAEYAYLKRFDIIGRLQAHENPTKVMREYRGMTQAHLAKKLRVSRSFVSDVENRKRGASVRIWRALADILNVPTALLMEIERGSPLREV